MVVRIARILSASMMLVLLAGVQPTVCDGWSLSNPFSSDSKPKKTAPRTVQKEPSTLDKIGTGTKNLLSRTGETLGLKKPEPKKPLYASPRPPVIQPPKKKEKSLLGSMFPSKEQKRPETVDQWMSNPRLDP